MEILNIETRYQGEIKLPQDLIEQLPQKIILATTVQYTDFMKKIKEQLRKKEVYFFPGKHGYYPGQILGCDSFKVKKEIEAFLYVGDGEFHPQALLVNEKPVFIYNPLSQEWKKLGRADWQRLKLRKKVALTHFYRADKIGILISTKPGQYNLKGALELKEKMKLSKNEKGLEKTKSFQKEKEVYLFLTDTIDLKELENFPFIDCWVNTACPRIVDDTKIPVVNLSELD